MAFHLPDPAGKEPRSVTQIAPDPSRRGRAAFTVVSRNYLAHARVLAKSYLAHHPGHQFLVVLVDELDEDYDGEGEPFELVPISDVPLPGRDAFLYQYTILELNTAVKPFCLAHFLATRDLEGIMYIDPDIMVFRPLDEAWDALRDHDVVLTPHMREPFADNSTPTEVGILQSGTYNLGFIGLRNGDEARKLLGWWSERLYTDCVVDIPNGLFVDQKWMDLVPAYFANTCILRDPTYNVAYWNLHERVVESAGGAFSVEGRPLAFFHYSGYSPLRPERLSKHQARHSLASLPGVKRLCDEYAQALWDSGHATVSHFPYAFGKLSNGVKVTRAVNRVVLHCVRNHIPFPSPTRSPDAFCRFLLTPNPAVAGTGIAPIVGAILDTRPDVASAFAGARHNARDPGFLQWLENTGGMEEGVVELLDKHGEVLDREDALSLVFAIYDRREDLRDAYPMAFSDDAQFQQFRDWLTTFGREEEAVDDAMLDAYDAAKRSFSKVLDAWFGRLDLLAAFPMPYSEAQIRGLERWFNEALLQFPGLAAGDVAMFARVALARREELVLACLRYNPSVRARIGGLPSALNSDLINDYLREAGVEGRTIGNIVSVLLAGQWIDPMTQFRAAASGNQEIRQIYPKAGTDARESRACAIEVLDRDSLASRNKSWSRWATQVLEGSLEPVRKGVNLFGYLRNTTGIGESARSMQRKLGALDIPLSSTTLASHYAAPRPGVAFDLATLYGGHDARNGVNVIVANADDFPRVRQWLPTDIWSDRHNVGYWVWETDRLPASVRTSARGLDAIWTPSEYSAQAIRATVDVPVEVLPHSLDFAALDAATPDRAAFGIPADALAFGYFFDSKSEYERKNPAGLIDAFRMAFGDRKDACLVLKVSSATPGRYDYEQLKLRAAGLNVVWIEDILDREQANSLMASLDAYVSLHRAEGFGLTMAEAMALGKPVVATGYSGNMEFMNDSSALLVDHRVIETTRAHGPYAAGTRWAQPDVAHAAARMRELEDPARARAIGQVGREHVRKVLDTGALAQRVAAALANLEGTHPCS